MLAQRSVCAYLCCRSRGEELASKLGRDHRLLSVGSGRESSPLLPVSLDGAGAEGGGAFLIE